MSKQALELHGVFLDGVFVEQGDGELRFVALPELSHLVVCELLQTIAARVQTGPQFR